MLRRKLPGKVGALLALLLLGACSEDPVDELSVSPVESRVEEKIVFSSEHAVSGSLLVRFDAHAVQQIEQTVAATTRAGGVATRSGLAGFDDVLAGIGVKSLRRVFPVDPRHEERMRAAGLHQWYFVGFDEEADLDRAAREMACVAEVDRVEFNLKLQHLAHGKAIPLTETSQVASGTRAGAAFNDPNLGLQWHFINTGDTSIYSGIKAGADVNCAEAWPICTGDPRVVVAVVDGSVQWDHPDLAANMWVNTKETANGKDSDNNGYVDDIHGYNFVSNAPLTLGGDDDADHGTHVAGTIAAVNGNGTGVCGIAGGSGKNDGVKIMSCQILSEGEGSTAEMSGRAIVYAANNGASILQCSYGYATGAFHSDSEFEKGAYSVEKEAIDYFTRTQNCDAVDGGIVIFAAGNDAMGISCYPGAYRNYISVTAMSCDYTPAYYSNYGPGCNIAAPGGDAYQSLLENRTGSSQILSTLSGGKYGYMQGTSMACPHVSGVAALGLSHALQQGKKFTQKEFVAMLLTSVNDINSYCVGTKPYITDAGAQATLDLSIFKNNMGSGYIDAFQLMMQIQGITALPVPVGKQVLLDLNPYIGGGNLNMRIVKAEIDAADKSRLGIASDPKVFGNKITITCTKSGSAIMRVTLSAGNGNGSGVSGLTFTKEYALVARAFHAENEGWF